MARKNGLLCDLVVTVGSYTDASGAKKAKSRNVGGLWMNGNRLFITIPGDAINPVIAAGAARASVAYKKSAGKDPDPDYDVNVSLMSDTGKPLSVSDLLGLLKDGSGGVSSSAPPEGEGSQDDIDFM